MNTIHKAHAPAEAPLEDPQEGRRHRARPRLSVKFSAKHIYAQAVNDDAGTTLVFLSSLDPGAAQAEARQANLAGAKVLGVAFAAKAKAAGLAGRVRPQRRPLPRQGQGLRRRRPRGRPRILTKAHEH
jgi:large subunit ribosomal protein L18